MMKSKHVSFPGIAFTAISALFLVGGLLDKQYGLLYVLFSIFIGIGAIVIPFVEQWEQRRLIKAIKELQRKL